MMRRILALLLLAVLALPVGAALAADDGYSTSYTYNYNFWGDVMESPDAYRVSTVLNSVNLGLEVSLKKPQSLFVQGSDLYVCDTGNNRIVKLTRKGESFTVTGIIDTVNGAEPATFNGPGDVFADVEGNIYVADTNNQRVVMMDKNAQHIRSYTKPADPTFDQSMNFLPNKITVDVAGRVYVLATNVNKGFVKYEADGTFTGYIGANKVTTTMAEYIWKTYFQTEVQRSQTENFVPTEYANMYMDDEGFIYAVTNVFSEYDLLYDNAKPIRRLNGVGNDILIKNDKYPPIGDLDWVEQGGDNNGPTKFVDITVLPDDIYVAFDKIRGRLFGYDSQGIMLWAFGTKGNVNGAFTGPVSLEHMGYDLLCLDQNENSITVFTPTEYGSLIYQAIGEYTRGDYDISADTWYKVLKFNANYNSAFIGIGRSLMRQEQYPEAMEYFKMAHDRVNYGRAFKYYRKEWVEKNAVWVVGILLVVILVPLVIGKVKKTKWEVAEHERGKIRK